MEIVVFGMYGSMGSNPWSGYYGAVRCDDLPAGRPQELIRNYAGTRIRRGRLIDVASRATASRYQAQQIGARAEERGDWLIFPMRVVWRGTRRGLPLDGGPNPIVRYLLSIEGGSYVDHQQV